jgi:hypothetical protein
VAKELSDYGELVAVQRDLIAKRNAAADPIERSRLTDLIANIEGLKKNPDDHALKLQMAKNMRSFNEYLAGRK